MVDFGNKLKELRLKEGLTQKQLAERIHVTKSVISYYELQERYPSPETLVKLAKVFHVTTDFLLGLENQQTLNVSELDDDEICLLKHTIEILQRKKRK